MSQLLQMAAEALTKAQPDIAGRSAFPPQSFWVEGNEIVVLCADGRKVRGALPATAAKKLIPGEPRSDTSIGGTRPEASSGGARLSGFGTSTLPGTSAPSGSSGTSHKPPVKKTGK